MSLTAETAVAEPEEARSIVIERLIGAPRELVFSAFTTAEHLAHWWGPTGFSITTFAFDFQVGGVWRFVMHGPNGRDFQNRLVFEAIEPPARIVSRHGGDGDDALEFAGHETRITLEPEGDKTRLTWRLVFASIAERDRIVREYGAVEGGQQTVGRLADYVAGLGVSAMTLRLYHHPLSSYSWKVLIPLYENATPFEPVIVDQTTHAAFLQVWPMGKFPVLVDNARAEVVPESSAIIDYLDRHRPGPVRFTSADPDRAWRTRLWDRFFDLHVMDPVQRIVADRNRPADSKDPFGVEEAHRKLANAYQVAEAEAARRTWSSGDDFGLADCAAAPALFYADKVQPFGPGQAAMRAYLDRLMARPSFARVLVEAEPYFKLFPQN